MTVEWLDSDTEDLGSGPVVVYHLDKARSRFEVRELPNQGYLIINRDGDWIRFAVMSFCCSDGKQTNVRLERLFHGEGPSGNLRECRHTWWGDEDGYVFYPDGRIILAAFKVLAEFFDEMV